MTSYLLEAIKLHFSKGTDTIFRAASLVLFFSLLHKSLTLPNSSCATVLFWEIDPLQLIKWNEIIQKKEKTLETELQRLHPDPLYPAVAVLTATGCSGSGNPTNQTFPSSGSEFNKRIKAVAGADQDFSSPFQKEWRHACPLL